MSTDDEPPSKGPLYIPVLIPVPVPIYVPIPMAMYNCPAPFPVGFALPIPTPLFMPVEPELADRIAAAIQESKKEFEESAAAACSIEKRLSPKPEEDDAQSDLEQSLPAYAIQMSVTASRKRSLSTSHSSTPSPKRLKDSDTTRSSSDGEESSLASNHSQLMPSSAPVKGGRFLKELGSKAWSRWLAKGKANPPGSASALSKPSKLSGLDVPEITSSLIDFVRQARKPDGEPYRPDVLLYFIYGNYAQQFFFSSCFKMDYFSIFALSTQDCNLDW